MTSKPPGGGRDHKQRMADLRDRAYEILEAAREDPDVSDRRVAELETGIELIELGWETVEDHPDPEAVAPFDLDAKLAQWERQFTAREKELGIR